LTTLRSMTGFGAADGMVGTAHVSVEVRSVNHRFFNPSIKLPASLSKWEPEVREALRRAIGRGHITVMARIDRLRNSDAVIDEPRFADYVNRLRLLKDKYKLEGEIDLATILRLPDVVASESEDDSGSADQLVAIVDRAVAALTQSRESEGRRLAQVLSDRLAIVDAAVKRLADRAPRRLVEQHDHLKEAVAALTSNVQLDEQRLAQEIAILADRLDVGEELDRFHSHLTAFREAISGHANEGVGKRLGFLLQELLREANTTGSKANDAEMTRDVIAIKEELERLREQVENLE
jgi:uncharacterized protein (TIGR00255 family)